MSSAQGEREIRRGRLRGWLQTIVFFAAAAILGMAVYAAVLVQQDRRAREEAATVVPMTSTAQFLQSRRGTPIPAPPEPISTGQVARVAELARWGDGGVLVVAWGPGGRMLAVGTTTGVYLYDGWTWEELYLLPTPSPVLHLAWAPAGGALAAGLYDGTAREWTGLGDTPAETSLTCPGPVRGVAFAPDGTLLVAGELGPGYAVWLARGEEVTVLGSETMGERPAGEEIPVAISADGQLLAARGPGNTLRVWRLGDAALLYEREAHWEWPSGPGDRVGRLAFSPNGQYLAYVLGGWTLLWHLGGEMEQQMATYGEGMAFSPDGGLLAVGANDGSLLLWQIEGNTVSRLRAIYGGRGPASDLAFSPDGLLAAALPVDGSVEIWQVPEGTPKTSLSLGAGWIRGAAFSPGGQIVAVGMLDGTAWLWGVRAGAPSQVLSVGASEHDGLSSGLRALAMAPDGRALAAGALDGSVYLWEVETAGRPRALGPEPPTPAPLPQAMVVSPEGSLMAGTVWSSWPESSARQSYVEAVSALLGWPGEETLLAGVTDLAFSPDGQLLAAAYDVGTVRLWPADGGEARHTLEHAAPVRGLAFFPDGRLLATAAGLEVRIWDVAGGRLVGMVQGLTSPVNAVAFSPDGLLAMGLEDGTVRLGYVTQAFVPRALGTEGVPVRSVAFSPDGELVAAGLGDGRVLLWRQRDGHLLRTLEGHTLAVVQVVFSPDGGLLLSTSQDGTLRLWGIGD